MMSCIKYIDIYILTLYTLYKKHIWNTNYFCRLWHQYISAFIQIKSETILHIPTVLFFCILCWQQFFMSSQHIYYVSHTFMSPVINHCRLLPPSLLSQYIKTLSYPPHIYIVNCVIQATSANTNIFFSSFHSSFLSTSYVHDSTCAVTYVGALHRYIGIVGVYSEMLFCTFVYLLISTYWRISF